MATENNHEAQIRRLWRHHGTALPTPRRGPRQQLSLDEILATAIAIADTEGLEAVSTRAVAAAFGKTPMALYPYVGTKAHLLDLMHDHACAPPPATASPAPGAAPYPESGAVGDGGLAGDLETWAAALFELFTTHPWLAERSWSRASPGPNERDWLERLLAILHTHDVAPELHAPTVTMLYATVQNCARTAADHRRLDPAGAAEWLAHTEATHRLIPDLAERYPRTATLIPVSPDWQQNPRITVTRAVHLIAAATMPR